MSRALADDIWVLVYADKDGKDCFAFWGGWNNRAIRWYKTKGRADAALSEIKRDKHRGKDLPENTRVVRFVMEETKEEIV